MSDDEEGSEFCSEDDEESSGSQTEEEGSEFWTEEEVQKSTEINWKKQYSLRECYVKLHDIAPKGSFKKFTFLVFYLRLNKSIINLFSCSNKREESRYTIGFQNSEDHGTVIK